MLEVRIEIVYGELDMMIARQIARVQMVEVMITNQDNFITGSFYNLTLLINLFKN